MTFATLELGGSMTRINLVHPSKLSTKHLVSEYREIARLPKNLEKSLSIGFNFTDIPPSYVLGKGHVKFFYNKFKYLKCRYEELVAEMLRRGYSPTYTDSSIFDRYIHLSVDYSPSIDEININIGRILERGGSI